MSKAGDAQQMTAPVKKKNATGMLRTGADMLFVFGAQLEYPGTCDSNYILIFDVQQPQKLLYSKRCVHVHECLLDTEVHHIPGSGQHFGAPPVGREEARKQHHIIV